LISLFDENGDDKKRDLTDLSGAWDKKEYDDFRTNTRIFDTIDEEPYLLKIVIDMDNTLTDLNGKHVRPGIKTLLQMLQNDRHTLILWTNSPKLRAMDILRENQLITYFSQFIYREDYDPSNRGLHKDIGKIGADLIIDDDPAEIEFNKKKKKRGILVKSFMSASTKMEPDEYKKIYSQVKKRKIWGLISEK